MIPAISLKVLHLLRDKENGMQVWCPPPSHTRSFFHLILICGQLKLRGLAEHVRVEMQIKIASCVLDALSWPFLTLSYSL